MLRSASVITFLLTACAPHDPPASNPPAEPVAARAPARSSQEDPVPEALAPDPLAQAVGIIDALAPKSRYLGQAQERELTAQGLDAPLATAALRELLRRCPAEAKQACDPHASELHVSILLDILDDRGTPEALPVVLQLDARGFFAWRTAESILAREMDEAAAPCTPPRDEEIAAAREALAGFRVVDRKGRRLQARSPSAAELDDLAYFYAAVSESAPAVGEQAVRGRPGREIDPTDAGQRHEQLERLDAAFASGDLVDARAAAVAYLASLGYPGPIDATREADQTWGGARFSYVMRDLAMISEVVGELGPASDLYLHANPGGGMCGTSTDYRRGKQLRGFIRTQERLGHCRAVVAHRLLDWEGDYDPHDPKARSRGVGYGPGRLARDGWDVPRIYRGALLTRNRGDEDALRHALRDDEVGLARLDQHGPEHWEHRVRAAEGLADVVGRDAMDELADVLSVADDALRERVLEAIGDAAQRYQAGPCDDSVLWWGGMSGSNVWSRPVSNFATDCRGQLSDAQAAALADRLLPFARAGAVDVRAQAMRTVGRLAVPTHEPRVTRWQRRATAAVHEACNGREEWSQRCQDAQTIGYAADEAWDAWARANGREVE